MKRILALVTALLLMLTAIPSLAAENEYDEQGRLIRYGEPVHLTAYFCRSNPRFNEGDDINHNIWIDTYKEKYNIDLEIVVLANGEDYKQKLTMAIASNSLPDLMYLDGSSYVQLAKAGKLKEVTDLFDLYTGDILRTTLMGDDQAVFKQAVIDGHLYGLPKTKGMIWPGSILYIRQDWLKNLNLSIPKTFDDVVEIARAFTFNDPDGNGVDDTYGLGLNNEMIAAADAGSIQGVLAAYGGFTNTWLYNEETGSVEYGALRQGTRDGLEKLASMFAEGLIDVEFGVKNADNVGEDIAAGKIGMYYGTAGGNLYFLNDCTLNDPTADWITIAAPDLNGDMATVGSSYVQADFFAVNQNCEYPEAMFLLANCFQDIINNPETTQETLDMYGIDPVTGVNKASYPYFACDPAVSKDIAYMKAIRDVREGKADESTLAPEAAKYWNGVKKFEADGRVIDPDNRWAWQYNMNYGTGSAIDRYLEEYESGHMVMSAWFGVPTKTMTKKMSTLEARQAEVFTKIISGSESIEAFDAFVEDWYRLGGTDITNEVTDWYKSYYLN